MNIFTLRLWYLSFFSWKKTAFFIHSFHPSIPSTVLSCLVAVFSDTSSPDGGLDEAASAILLAGQWIDKYTERERERERLLYPYTRRGLLLLLLLCVWSISSHWEWKKETYAYDNGCSAWEREERLITKVYTVGGAYNRLDRPTAVFFFLSFFLSLNDTDRVWVQPSRFARVCRHLSLLSLKSHGW